MTKETGIMKSSRRYFYNKDQWEILFYRLESMIEVFKNENLYVSHKTYLLKDKAVLEIKCK